MSANTIGLLIAERAYIGHPHLRNSAICLDVFLFLVHGILRFIYRSSFFPDIRWGYVIVQRCCYRNGNLLGYFEPVDVNYASTCIGVCRMMVVLGWLGFACHAESEDVSSSPEDRHLIQDVADAADAVLLSQNIFQ